MYRHEKEAIAKAIHDAGCITAMQIRDVVAVLDDYFTDRCAFTWEIEDVKHAADAAGTTVTDEEAREVLQLMLRRHDANVGVNWESISYCIDALRREKA